MQFDRDKEPWEQITVNRYAHKLCAEKNKVTVSTQEQDYNQLVEYIEKLFGVGYVSAKIAKQIRDYRQMYGYTFSGMLGTLIYWFEIRKGTLDKANGGIGIIPYVYDQAKEYYAKINAANELNAGVVNYKWKVTEIEIEAPQPEPRSVKLFKLKEEEV